MSATMNEDEYAEAFRQVRDLLRGAVANDVAKYDQTLASYKDVLRSFIGVGDVAFHNLGPDLVIPAVGTVIEQAAETTLAELGPEKVIFDLSVLLACAIDEILKLDHEPGRPDAG